MLAVVDELAGFAIGKRGRPAAEPRARFEHEDARASPGQPVAALSPAKPAPMTMTS